MPLTATPSPPASPLHPPVHAPPPQASLTHLPPTLLQAIAKTAGTTIPNLATVTAPSNSVLYGALTSYVGLSDRTGPLFTDFGEPQSSSSSSSDDGSPRRHRRRGRRGDRPHIPSYAMGLGITKITWPPAPEFSAERLAEKKGGKRRRRDKVIDEPVKSQEVVVAHYTVGEPRGDGHTIKTMKEALIACKEGQDTLKRIGKELCAWQWEREGEPKERADRFELYRFRTERNSGMWQSEGFKRARPGTSVILPEGMLNEILGDLRRFLSPETKKWYRMHGLPSRRSYLFFGPPGTGKTSTIKVMASVFGLCVCYLSMTDAGFSNQMVGDALSELPRRALIVLEDVDALFNEDRKSDLGNSLTFSGLLNMLDGVISVDNVITVMTTNHFEKLDKALIRGGRVDRRFHFDRPTQAQIRALFMSFYPDAKGEHADKFLRAVTDRREEEARMISTLQELFIKMREKSAEECANSVNDFFDSHFPGQGDKKGRDLYI